MIVDLNGLTKKEFQKNFTYLIILSDFGKWIEPRTLQPTLFLVPFTATLNSTNLVQDAR